MDFAKVQDYLTELVPSRAAAMLRMEEEARVNDFPIIGAASGQLCYLMAKIAGAKRIYELGSGYGYSTAWFAKAILELAEGEDNSGEVVHVVWDEALSQQARANLDELGYASVVRFVIGEAVAALEDDSEKYDLIFLDIDKEGYPDAVAVIENHLRDGGLLIADNMLRDGRIFDPGNTNPSIEGIRIFTRMISESPQWAFTISPVRDGVMVAQFRG